MTKTVNGCPIIDLIRRSPRRKRKALAVESGGGNGGKEGKEMGKVEKAGTMGRRDGGEASGLKI